ncbi:unnamed protein product [Effrenium voratum]|uniref:Protein kinase domain-containing protein n=1 Tax=Effrenium voratum TaxID=2562239 RepID=A0AA36I8G2_9DINO|nr:unnamed protein product [Effrenium voratum]
MNATGALPTPKEPERETWQLLMQLGLDLRTRRKSSIISAECGIDDAYDFQDLLGKGGFGKVFQAVSKKDGQPCAIKCVDMKNTDPEVFQRELEQARKLQNPHLVRLIAAYQDERTFFLVMELYQGGDLLTEVTQHGLRREGSGLAVGIPEQCLVEYAWQMFSAVAYLHYHFIAHRDIKCENFMKASLAANAPLKLIDLGVSACFKGGLTEVVGTITTIAPEVFSRRYNEQCDLWSVGVTLFMCAVCMEPWVTDGGVRYMNESEIKRCLVDPGFQIPYDRRRWDLRSTEIRTLVRSLLVRDPQKRPRAQEVLSQNRWVKGCRKPRCCRWF